MPSDIRKIINKLSRNINVDWSVTASPERFEADIGDASVEISRWEHDDNEYDRPYKAYEFIVRNSKGWIAEELISSDRDDEDGENVRDVYLTARRIALKSQTLLEELAAAIDALPEPEDE